MLLTGSNCPCQILELRARGVSLGALSDVPFESDLTESRSLQPSVRVRPERRGQARSSTGDSGTVLLVD